MATVYKRGGKKAKGPYYAEWFDHTGKRRRKSTRTTDKATAERIAKKYEADAALRRDGVIDPTLDEISKQSQRLIADHLADFESKLKAANKTKQHISETLNYIKRICEHGQFATAADITADQVNSYAKVLNDKGRSARTIQAYLAAIKSFTKWLTDHHKLPRDPLAAVKKPNPKADRRHSRRMLLPEEWRLLEAVTEAGPERNGMPAKERVLLYQTAIQTGLRSKELRSLTRGKIQRDAKQQPYLACQAGSTKNRQDARQYIQPELETELISHCATKASKAPVFGMPHRTNIARMLRDDLAEARKLWLKEAKDDPQEYAQREASDFLADTNHEGEVMDFHCLRHTCGAWLAMTGAHPKVVQTVMRHSAITLTMDTYGHLFPGQEADAVSGMRSMLSADEPTEPETLKATGTDAIDWQQIWQQSGRENGQSGAKRCEGEKDDRQETKTPKPIRIADLGDELQDDAKESESTLETTLFVTTLASPIVA